MDRGGFRLSGKNTRYPEKPPKSKAQRWKVINDFREKSEKTTTTTSTQQQLF
jgi:hypothetical protein